MKEAFVKLIHSLPDDLEVLEVGVNGHDGENTSEFLYEYFDNLTGVNIRPEKIADWQERHPDSYCFVEDWYASTPQEYDLLVLDMNIENNLDDWTDEGLAWADQWVRRGGYLINYIMTTTEYGDPKETPRLLAEHRDRWWGSFKNEDIGKKLTSLRDWELIAIETEVRRVYISWVLLQKK